jgi:hypothetical protein
MKKPVLFMLMLCITVISFGQRRSAQLGLKAGVNIANYNDDIPTTDPRIGFHGGLLVHIHVRPDIAIQPEFVYSQQGAEFYNGKQKIDYLNIPILFQYLFKKGFRLETGPQIGVLADAEFKYENGTEVNIKKDVQKTDVGWVFGLGYLATSGFGVDARYNVGLTDIGKGPGEIKNRVWQLGVFYQFRR